MSGRGSPRLSIALLVVLTEAVYFLPSIYRDGLLGSDYLQLHARHIAFARDALLGAGHFLPGWYPRELLGAPFAANLQSFPWIPTRLLVLFLEPNLVYAVAVAIAAGLAAVFTYLYCKRVGLSELGAVSAGWTFACAGFFASRVMAGHLPLLEAYPSLPLLLWLADRAVAPDRAPHQVRDLVALALAASCVALAGHPQLPAYSLGAALVYLMVRGRGRRVVWAASALALGVTSTLFAWWPMILLIQRSTRVLPLAPPANDLAMPYGRLLALIWPAVDGWPELLERQPLFHGYPNDAYFWDTASYIGLLPLIAILFLLIRTLATKRLPAPPFAFVAVLGTVALLFSLPFAQPLHRLIHGTFLRSPSRLFYLCTFCASIALGCVVDAFRASRWLNLRARGIVLALLLAGHAIDLGRFDRLFIQPLSPEDLALDFAPDLDRELHDARIAADDPVYHGRYDDAGIFDSILLANPYRAMLRLAGLPRDLNEQRLNAATFPIPALQAAGVRFVVTSEERRDLELVRSTDDENLYRVSNPAPRAAFLSPAHLPAAETIYSRPSSDEIRVDVNAPTPRLVDVLESYDPGWSAKLDGAPIPVVLANGFTMAVPVTPGKHEITLNYRTPGRRLGYVLSLTSLVLLVCLIRIASKK